MDKGEAAEIIKNAEWQYVRRQKTWFKRNKFIHWFESQKRAYSYIKNQLNT
jgi:tRNA A37 N6-isopentenylltransferase MiaA